MPCSVIWSWFGILRYRRDTTRASSVSCSVRTSTRSSRVTIPNPDSGVALDAERLVVRSLEVAQDTFDFPGILLAVREQLGRLGAQPAQRGLPTLFRGARCPLPCIRSIAIPGFHCLRHGAFTIYHTNDWQASFDLDQPYRVDKRRCTGAFDRAQRPTIAPAVVTTVWKLRTGVPESVDPGQARPAVSRYSVLVRKKARNQGHVQTYSGTG